MCFKGFGLCRFHHGVATVTRLLRPLPLLLGSVVHPYCDTKSAKIAYFSRLQFAEGHWQL
jgi:hypothetical protein